MHHKRPLDWEAVLKSDVPLKVVASCLDTLQPIILEDFTSAQVRKHFQYPAEPNSSMPALSHVFSVYLESRRELHEPVSGYGMMILWHSSEYQVKSWCSARIAR
jgi:hypothetical protein